MWSSCGRTVYVIDGAARRGPRDCAGALRDCGCRGCVCCGECILRGRDAGGRGRERGRRVVGARGRDRIERERERKSKAAGAWVHRVLDRGLPAGNDRVQAGQLRGLHATMCVTPCALLRAWCSCDPVRICRQTVATDDFPELTTGAKVPSSAKVSRRNEPGELGVGKVPVLLSEKSLASAARLNPHTYTKRARARIRSFNFPTDGRRTKPDSGANSQM